MAHELKALKPIITRELQETLISNPGIKKVHFDYKGRHYFNVFELLSGKEGDKEKALYGTGVYWKHQVIPGHNPEKVKEVISKGDPTTKIVESLTREQVIDTEIADESDALKLFAGMSKSQLKALKAMLASSDEDESVEL